VTKVGVGYRGVLELETIRGQEAEGWRAMAGKGDPLSPRLLDQVQLVSPMLASQQPTLKSLRDAAALLHAPLLVVYLQQDSSDDGYNSAAMAYWTIIGLFLVPGHTVGHYSTCQAVLIDTRSGFVLATAYGESLKEENVLPGAVPIAIDRTCRQAREAAVAALQQDFRATLAGLAVGRGVLGR
jgi:rhombotail lipoprotein